MSHRPPFLPSPAASRRHLLLLEYGCSSNVTGPSCTRRGSTPSSRRRSGPAATASRRVVRCLRRGVEPPHRALDVRRRVGRSRVRTPRIRDPGLLGGKRGLRSTRHGLGGGLALRRRGGRGRDPRSPRVPVGGGPSPWPGLRHWLHAGRVVRRLLHDAGLLTYFDVCVLSDEVGVRKPDPRMFHTALERWQPRLPQRSRRRPAVHRRRGSARRSEWRQSGFAPSTMIRASNPRRISPPTPTPSCRRLRTRTRLTARFPEIHPRVLGVRPRVLRESPVICSGTRMRTRAGPRRRVPHGRGVRGPMTPGGWMFELDSREVREGPDVRHDRQRATPRSSPRARSWSAEACPRSPSATMTATASRTWPSEADRLLTWQSRRRVRSAWKSSRWDPFFAGESAISGRGSYSQASVLPIESWP